METPQAPQSGHAGRRATVVAWTLAGGIAGIVFGILRVFRGSKECIYWASFGGDRPRVHADLGFCAQDFWVSGALWFLVGAVVAGSVALLVVSLRTR